MNLHTMHQTRTQKRQLLSHGNETFVLRITHNGVIDPRLRYTKLLIKDKHLMLTNRLQSIDLTKFTPVITVADSALQQPTKEEKGEQREEKIPVYKITLQQLSPVILGDTEGEDFSLVAIPICEIDSCTVNVLLLRKWQIQIVSVLKDTIKSICPNIIGADTLLSEITWSKQQQTIDEFSATMSLMGCADDTMTVQSEEGCLADVININKSGCFIDLAGVKYLPELSTIELATKIGIANSDYTLWFTNLQDIEQTSFSSWLTKASRPYKIKVLDITYDLCNIPKEKYEDTYSKLNNYGYLYNKTTTFMLTKEQMKFMGDKPIELFSDNKVINVYDKDPELLQQIEFAYLFTLSYQVYFMEIPTVVKGLGTQYAVSIHIGTGNPRMQRVVGIKIKDSKVIKLISPKVNSENNIAQNEMEWGAQEDGSINITLTSLFDFDYGERNLVDKVKCTTYSGKELLHQTRLLILERIYEGKPLFGERS